MINADSNEVYNVSFRDEKTNVEVIENVLSVLGKSWDDWVEHVDDRLGHDFRYSITNHKMIQFVDFEPTPFSEGLKETINWFKE